MTNELFYGDNLGVRRDPGIGQTFPKLQVFTLAELFQGKQLKIPMIDRQAGFKKAKREEMGRQERLI